MKYSHRLRKLEHTKSPVLSQEEQERRLLAFIECETMVTGCAPTEAKIEAERQRLAQPIIRQPKSPEQIRTIAEEVYRIVSCKEHNAKGREKQCTAARLQRNGMKPGTGKAQSRRKKITVSGTK